jgi:hypothetical protein
MAETLVLVFLLSLGAGFLFAVVVWRIGEWMR